METPVPRPAATVVLLRDSADGPLCLITIRPRSMRFMGGAAVFPGGGVAGADDDSRWAGASAGEDPDRAFRVAALRECFEEVGLLLASGPAERLRRADAEDPERFLAACLSLGLKLRTDLLVPAGRWVTPLGAPVRFDTRFFIARAPDGWEPDPDPSEVESCMWITPRAALEGVGDGSLLMAPPTIEMLQRLQAHGAADEALDALATVPLDGAGDVLSWRLSPTVQVILAPNPSVMTGPGTNSYVVGTGPHIVIDPAVDDEAYIAALLQAAPGVSEIVVTHRHPDHVGGVKAIAERSGAPVRAFGPEPAGGVPVTPLHDGDVLVAGGVNLRVLHCPGHASDHICLYLDGAASLFAGDNILGEGTAVIAPPDGNMKQYLATLERLRTLHIDRIFTGHFRPLDGGTAVIDGYLAHREARKQSVVAALGAGPLTPEEIVAIVYTDTPEHLHPVAVHQVQGMLEMLAGDGVVVQDGQRFRLV